VTPNSTVGTTQIRAGVTAVFYALRISRPPTRNEPSAVVATRGNAAAVALLNCFIRDLPERGKVVSPTCRVAPTHPTLRMDEAHRFSPSKCRR